MFQDRPPALTRCVNGPDLRLHPIPLTTRIQYSHIQIILVSVLEMFVMLLVEDTTMQHLNV